MKSKIALIGALAIVVAACGGSSTLEDATTSSVPKPTTTPASSSSTSIPLIDPADVVVPLHLTSMDQIWMTDFSKTIIDLNELLVGIPSADPRDAIPPIDDPQFEPVAESDWLADPEPGVVLDIEGDARFYPLSVLTRHEIINDEVGGTPVAVTYCPLCNTAVTFDRRFEDEVLRLGVSGLLRNSDLVMWDNVTQTLWQQITGEAIVGEHAGKSLTRLGSAIVRWADFKAAHPDGLVLGPDQGYGRAYGTNTYTFYSSRAQPYGFYTGEIDPRYPAMERVVGVAVNDLNKAYPFSEISEVRVVNDVIGGQPVAIFWGAADTADALDATRISEGQGIGTGVAFDPVVNGQLLTFEATGDTEFTDNETGTVWSILGVALEGPLAGEELSLIPHTNEFWFAWQAFFPDGEVWTDAS